jgi:hypothetical protein
MVTLDMIRKPVEGDLEAFEQFLAPLLSRTGKGPHPLAGLKVPALLENQALPLPSQN